MRLLLFRENFGILKLGFGVFTKRVASVVPGPILVPKSFAMDSELIIIYAC